MAPLGAFIYDQWVQGRNSEMVQNMSALIEATANGDLTQLMSDIFVDRSLDDYASGAARFAGDMYDGAVDATSRAFEWLANPNLDASAIAKAVGGLVGESVLYSPLGGSAAAKTGAGAADFFSGILAALKKTGRPEMPKPEMRTDPPLGNFDDIEIDDGVVFGGVPNKIPQSYYDDLALQATKNPYSNRVVLGKFLEDGKSYTKVGAHYEASYFKLDNWRELDNSLDDMWPINEAFLDQQVRAGKEIILSHDPAKATGYFKREVDYLKDLGFKFEQDNWVWKARIDE